MMNWNRNMNLSAFFYVGPRNKGGTWEIEASLGADIRDDLQSQLIFFGVAMDFIELQETAYGKRLEHLLAGDGICVVGDHPSCAGNEWYITPLKEGVVIEHQWSEEFQRDGAGWYTWDLVRAVVELSIWRNRMRENLSGLGIDTLRSARMSVKVHNWKPPQSLASLGWKSCMD
jgi:hypothetical protein